LSLKVSWLAQWLMVWNAKRYSIAPHHNMPEPQMPYSCTRPHSNTRWKFRTAAGWS
jgi:hypothetical protein